MQAVVLSSPSTSSPSSSLGLPALRRPLASPRLTYLNDAATAVLQTGERGEGVRLREDHPTNFSPILCFEQPVLEHIAQQSTLRLFVGHQFHESNLAHYERLCLRHFGDKSCRWGRRSARSVEMFLREYLDNPAVHVKRMYERYDDTRDQSAWFIEAFVGTP